MSLIEISGAENLRGLQNLKGRSIFFINTKKLSDDLYNINPQIKSFKISKIYPNKIYIDVDKYSSLANFKLYKGYFLLSEDGRILEKKRTKERNMTIINYYQNFHFEDFNVGEKLEYKDILDSLVLLAKISYLGIKIDSVDINGLDMLIFNSGGKKFIFTTNKEKELQYREFKTIIERFKIERTEYEVIDLRFDKPVIKLM